MKKCTALFIILEEECKLKLHLWHFVYLYGWQKKSQSLTHFIAETEKTLLHISFGNINWYNP